MIKKLGFATALSVLLFSGCGGGGSDTTTMPVTQATSTPTSEEKLELIIDNVTIDANSTLSRVSTIIPQNQELVQMFQFNKEVTIKIKGKDAEKFYFQDNSSLKRYDLFLYDTQFEGEFEIDIYASADDETIIYKVKYIIQESTSRKLLINKTLYFMDTDEVNTYKIYKFSDEIVTIKELNIETNELKNENTVGILYANDYVISNLFKDANTSQECKIKHIDNQYALHYPSMEFSCMYENTRSYGDNYYMRFNKEDAIIK